MGRLVVAGPRSRDLLRDAVTDADPDTVLGNRRFPWLSFRDVEFGMCPVRALRVSYTGALGWELHHPIEIQNYLFDRLCSTGESHDLKMFGARAQNWLRMEKSYRAFGTELGRDATPLEAGLDRFVDLSKAFRGKEAMIETGIRFKCVTLVVDGPDDICPWGREALYRGSDRVGRLTSGGHSVTFGKSIAMGYVDCQSAEPGTALSVTIQDRRWPATVVADSPYDPKNAELRRDG